MKIYVRIIINNQMAGGGLNVMVAETIQYDTIRYNAMQYNAIQYNNVIQ